MDIEAYDDVGLDVETEVSSQKILAQCGKNLSYRKKMTLETICRAVLIASFASLLLAADLRKNATGLNTGFINKADGDGEHKAKTYAKKTTIKRLKAQGFEVLYYVAEADDEIRFFWKDAKNQPIRGLEHLQRTLSKSGEQLLFAINGGIL